MRLVSLIPKYPWLFPDFLHSETYLASPYWHLSAVVCRGESEQDDSHPRQGDTQRMKLQKLKCFN